MVYDSYRASGNLAPILRRGTVDDNAAGVVSRSALYTLAAGESAQILNFQPRRIWALITNNSLDWCRVMFASTGALAANGHRLDIGGSVLINCDMQWIGAVVVFAPVGGGGCTLTVTEVSLVCDGQ
jgi:hypothetical protein